MIALIGFLKKALLKSSLLVLLGIGGGEAIQFWYKIKGANFRQLWVFSGEAKSPGAKSSALPPEFFLGPYRYLGKGHQCFAFESLDGRYVLKLPRIHRRTVPFWGKCALLPERVRRRIANDRQGRLAFVRESFRIASQEFSEGTSVFYEHFSRTSDLPAPCIVYDLLGRPHAIDLNRTGFLLQEKKPLMMPRLLQALKEQKREEAVRILDAFLELLSTRARLGLFNKDFSFAENFAYEKGVVIQIDVGSFFRRPGVPLSETYEKSIRQGTRHIRKWISQTDEDLLKRFDARLEELIANERASQKGNKGESLEGCFKNDRPLRYIDRK